MYSVSLSGSVGWTHHGSPSPQEPQGAESFLRSKVPAMRRAGCRDDVAHGFRGVLSLREVLRNLVGRQARIHPRLRTANRLADRQLQPFSSLLSHRSATGAAGRAALSCVLWPSPAGADTMHPASVAGVPRRIIAPVTSAISCAVAVAESWTVRHTVSLMLKIMWLSVPGSRGGDRQAGHFVFDCQPGQLMFRGVVYNPSSHDWAGPAP